MKWLLAGLALGFLPVWRAAGAENMNLWEYLSYMRSEEYWQRHTSYETALMHARRAWRYSDR